MSASLLSGLALSLLLASIVRAQSVGPTSQLTRPNYMALVATVYTVTKSSDTNDGSCSVADCSLREAVVAANGNAGVDTILIPAGTYNLTSGANGDIDITSSVIISGAGAGLSIINANFPVTSTDRIFDIIGAGVTLSGVTLRNGKVTGGSGGGINLNAASTLTLTFSTLHNNSADHGGGLRNAGGKVLLDNVSLYSNTANSTGGAIRTENGSGVLTITNSSIYSNIAQTDGGGLYVSGGVANIFTTTLGPTNQTLNGHGAGLSVNTNAVANLTNVSVVSNTATGDGGGAYNLGTLSFSDSLIQANTALSTTGSGNGGGLNNQAGQLTLTGVTLNNNVAQGGAGGGGLRNSLGTVTIIQSTLAGNHANASVGNGGAILHSSGQLIISQSLIGVLGNGNFSGANGGGISAASGTLVTITTSSLSSNSSGDDGGGIDATGTTLYVADTSFISNTIRTGIAGDGGAIRSDSGGTATLVGVTLSGNVAENGGGIVNIDATLIVVSSTLRYNTARNGNGGGIDNRRETMTPTLVITGSSIFSNTSTNGSGGGLRSMGLGGSASTTIDNSTISYNQVVNGNGGGLRNEGGSLMQLANVTLTYNNRTPSGSGEGLSVSGGTVLLQNTLIAYNDNSSNNCAGTLTSLNFNLDSGNSCSLGGADDIINASPSLGVFQNNGGPTWSQPLASPSAGINQGDNISGCTAAGGGQVLTIDQRGFTRPVGGRCDIGAVERIGGDVAISLTNHQTSVIPGAAITYTLIVSNLSSIALTNITVSDTLPAPLAGLTWSCSATGGSSCPANGSGNISTTVNLASGGRATFTLIGQVVDTATGTLVHTATAAAPMGYDDPAGNNTATDTDPLTPQADVGLTNSDGQTSAIPGTPITYTIVVTSAGPSAAPNALISDTFPAALNNIAWVCTPSGGATCPANGSGNLNAIVTLTAGSQVVFLVTGDIDPAATGALTNVATITLSGVASIGSAPNTAQDVTPLNPTIDLGIAKTDSQATTRPGEAITYTLLVSNTGPSQVMNALITDTFPVQILTPLWGCVASAGATCPVNGSGSLNISVSLMPNSAVTITIIGAVALTSTGVLTNTAYVSPPPGVTETGPLPNSATDVTLLVPFEADLKVTAAHPPTATPGTPLTFTITVRNVGPDVANSAHLTDIFPTTLQNPVWTCITSGGAACPANGAGNLATAISLPVNGAVTFTIGGNLAVDATGVLSHTAIALPPPEFGDPLPEDNQVILNLTLVPQGDLSVTLTADQSTALPGDTLTYTLTVNNSGPSTMANTLVTGTFPTSLANVNWSCLASNGSVCPISGSGNINTTITLSPNGTVTFTIIALVTVGGTLVNTATVAPAPGALDPNPGNNSASQVTSVLTFIYLPLLRR